VDLKDRCMIIYFVKTVSLLGKEQFHCFVWMEGEAQWAEVQTPELVDTASVKQTNK